jgi:hypothetical protein
MMNKKDFASSLQLKKLAKHMLSPVFSCFVGKGDQKVEGVGLDRAIFYRSARDVGNSNIVFHFKSDIP